MFTEAASYFLSHLHCLLGVPHPLGDLGKATAHFNWYHGLFKNNLRTPPFQQFIVVDLFEKKTGWGDEGWFSMHGVLCK